MLNDYDSFDTCIYMLDGLCCTTYMSAPSGLDDLLLLHVLYM